MSPEIVERIFEPFFTTKGVGKGSGLGLSQVHGFVKRWSGHILMDSKPGEGTALSLYLPRNVPSGERSSTADAHPHHAPRGSEPVLIVDDNEDVREVTTVIVRSLGYEVLTARDATEALAWVRRRGGIDLLMGDIVMFGGIDGFELADRAHALRPGLRVPLMSGYPAEAFRGATSLFCTSPSSRGVGPSPPGSPRRSGYAPKFVITEFIRPSMLRGHLGGGGNQPF
jgi:CheY-like chemotaxis protein